MRNKIKELMQKEEGFTLVELLAVIVILGIIIAIAVPSVGTLIDNADADAIESEQELIIDAGKMYYMSDDTAQNSDGTNNSVSVRTLIDEGYLEDSVSEENSGGSVSRTETGSQVTYGFTQ